MPHTSSSRRDDGNFLAASHPEIPNPGSRLSRRETLPGPVHQHGRELTSHVSKRLHELAVKRQECRIQPPCLVSSRLSSCPGFSYQTAMRVETCRSDPRTCGNAVNSGVPICRVTNGPGRQASPCSGSVLISGVVYIVRARWACTEPGGTRL